MSGRSQEIADEIAQAILAHRLVPGTKLGERELGEIFAVSRIVVRQALIRLAEDGLVTLERHRGAFVARPSLQEALEIFDALTLIEQGVIAQLDNRLGPAAQRELRAQSERERAALGRGHDRLAGHLGREFHDLLVRLTRNRVLAEIHGQLVRRVRLLEALYRSEFDHGQLCADHARLVDLLARRQLGRAQQLVGAHYRLVARGHRVEEDDLEPVPLREALRPLPRKTRRARADGRGPIAAPGARTRAGARPRPSQ